jgi:hypothetical protein
MSIRKITAAILTAFTLLGFAGITAAGAGASVTASAQPATWYHG